MSNPKKILGGLAIIALLGTVTNYIYFSPLLTLLLPLCLFVFNKNKLARPIFWLYVYSALFLMSAIIYDWHSIFNYGFFRRDGNFIISYAPLLLLPLFSLKFNLQKYFRYFYIFTLVLYGILFIYHLLTVNLGADIRNIVFGGLFIAQNAVGGFLSIIAALGWSYYYHKRNKKELLFFIIIFAIMLATYSRGSFLGLVLGIFAWYLVNKKRFKSLIFLLLVPVILTIGCIYIGYPNFKNVIGTQNEVETQIDTEVGTKNANIIIRVFYTFPRAYYIFTHSPIIGTGVGSYDDRPLVIEEVMPYISYNSQPEKAHTDAHAHHSYLHILAEQGIVGLVCFLTFWVSLFFYLVRISGRPIIKDYLLIAYFTLTFAAFTEHRITTPSNMLPFTISVGLFMMKERTFKTYIIEKKQGA